MTRARAVRVSMLQQKGCVFAGSRMLPHQVTSAQIRAAEYFQEQQMQLGQAIWRSGVWVIGAGGHGSAVESTVHDECSSTFRSLQEMAVEDLRRDAHNFCAGPHVFQILPGGGNLSLRYEQYLLELQRYQQACSGGLGL